MPEITEEIIGTPEELQECIAYLSQCSVLGFDTEFVGEETYHPRLCLVQVATPKRLFLLDPLSIGALDSFWQLLLDPARTVVVHAGREEVRLCRLWSGASPANLFDLQLAAGLAGYSYPLGHGALVGQILGVKLAKAETLTEWRRRPLTPEQIRYAFDDVRFLLRSYERLRNRLAKLNRLDWATEEFSRLARIAGPEDPATEERWRKLKGAGSLDRKKLAVVRALHQWRENKAAQLNRPARTLIRDDLLVEIARRNPSRPRDLQVVRGLPSRDLEDIVEVVLQARQIPLERCPIPMEREQDPPQLTVISGILIAVLADFCTREKLAQSLVASNNDLREIIRARLTGEPIPDVPLTRGWRGTHVLPRLIDVLEGKLAVRLGNLRSDSPLDYHD